MDPSELENGPSAALIKSEPFEKWLEENDLQIIWFIGGEKQIFSDEGYVSRWLEFNFIYYGENEEIKKVHWVDKLEYNR